MISMKIEWDVEVSKILAENIVIAELSEENQHSFVSLSTQYFVQRKKTLNNFNLRIKNRLHFVRVIRVKSVSY